MKITEVIKTYLEFSFDDLEISEIEFKKQVKTDPEFKNRLRDAILNTLDNHINLIISSHFNNINDDERVELIEMLSNKIYTNALEIYKKGDH